MEGPAASVKRTTRASCKRRPKTVSQAEQVKKRRPAGHRRQENMLAITIKQHPVKMQDISIGLQRLQQPLAITKENYLVRGAVKAKPVPTAGRREGLTCALSSASELMEVTPPASQDTSEEEEVRMTAGPLPRLSWANSRELWVAMRAKDVTKMAPEQELRSLHPGILPSMRTILFDWLMEVCEEYKLHRETYYLATDFHDRFMDSWKSIQKEHLQAIGITCLFIASKIEEIYPPKVSEFAYVTDGACSVADILEMELLICKALKWRLNHHVVTVNTWVNTYMQVSSHHLRPPGVKTREFEYPAYSPVEFIRVLQLLDFCTLDLSSRSFSNSVLAASALYLASERSRQHFTAITGLELDDINICVGWMYPFAVVISREGPITQRQFPGVIPQDVHNIQTHTVTIAMLDDAMELRSSQEALATHHDLIFPPDCSVIMTPPRQQDRRCLAPINVSTTN